MKTKESEVIVLGIDTTSKECSLCITSNNELLTEYCFISDNNLSSRIIEIIDFVLRGVNLTLEDINVYGVGIGPGIFTGIRVGMVTIKGLVFERKAQIVPVNTLDAMAIKYKNSEKSVVSMVDAKRGQVYISVCEYSKNNDDLSIIYEPSLISISDIENFLDKNQEYIFVGSGVSNNIELLKNIFTGSNCFVDSKFLAYQIAQITYKEFKAGRGETDIERVNPLYIKRTDAEENYERDNKKDKK
jgi:tRNA threonylcarbamoyladenosine biosynthesis protein TsaB